MNVRRAIRSTATVVTLSCAAGCASTSETEVVVFAASSLTDVFDELAAEFEVSHPDADVVINAQGSAQLAAQIEQGAPADVFAAADRRSMDRVSEELEGPAPVVFARNVMVLAVPAGNPRGIVGLSELADPKLIVVVAAPEVPAGAYAQQMFDAAGLDVEPDSFEQSVRSVAAKVALGEADAGVVYRTDVLADDERLDLVEVDGASAEYTIARLTDDPLAAAFVDFVLGEVGREILAAAGFELP